MPPLCPRSAILPPAGNGAILPVLRQPPPYYARFCYSAFRVETGLLCPSPRRHNPPGPTGFKSSFF